MSVEYRPTRPPAGDDTRHDKYDLDLREGEAREGAFVQVLLGARVEHKRDRKCATTGNIAIEYEQRCSDGHVRASGIGATQADRYAIEFAPDAWLLVRTDDLKHLARRAIREKRDRWLGDGNNSHTALIPFDWFRGIGERRHLEAVA